MLNLLKASIDWIYPPVCINCSTPGLRICPDCSSCIIRITEPICDRCGNPTVVSGYCKNCRSDSSVNIRIRSWAVYGGVIQKTIHRLKYKKEMFLGFEIVKKMADFLDQINWKIDLVLPIPLGKNRRVEREYNQAGLIAFPIASWKGWNYSTKGLTRIRETDSQVGLNIKQRKENMKDAFKADQRIVSGKNILLVDDVATTCSTIFACAEALKDAGSNSLYAITLARSVFGQSK